MILKNKTAVITGSSSGIGRAMAIEFANQGAQVVVHANRSIEKAQQVVSEIQNNDGAATLIAADLQEVASQDQFCQQAWAWQGKVDILVNNAGVDVLTGESASWTFEQKLASLFAVDVMATMRLSRNLGQRMVEHLPLISDPNIINIGWDQAASGMEGDSGEMFGAIKSAVIGFSKSLACSLAPHVRVNCIAPGWIQTSWGNEASDYWQKRAKGQSLLQRWGTPEDVANVALFLASQQSNFVNGQVIPVNGGFKSSLGEND